MTVRVFALVLALVVQGAFANSIWKMFRGHNTDISGLRREDVFDSMSQVLSATTRTFGYDMPSTDKIREIREKISNSKKLPQHESWVKSGNVARYNGMKPEPYVTVPIVLNVVFLGFDGDGHHALKITPEQLKPWFERMERNIEQTRVTTDDYHRAKQDTHVYYDYQYHVIEFDSDVNTVLEAVIWDNARPENPWVEDASDPDALQYFVDVTAVTDVLDTIVESLAMDDSYTLFVLNPKLPHQGFRYGYRYGFSTPELLRLRENLQLVLDLQARPEPRPPPHFPEVFLAEIEERHKHANSSFLYRMMRNESREWAETYMSALHDLTYWKRHPAEESWEEQQQEGEEAEKNPPPRDMLFEVAATKLLQSKSPADVEYMRSVLHEPWATANCLVDTWVADKRYAFIDLSAGPFEWGPTVGGEGVRSTRTIPSLADISVAVRDFSAGGKWNDTAYVHRLERQLRKHGAEILKKEQELLLTFLSQQCSGQQDSVGEIGSCKELRHKLSAVQTYLAKHDENHIDPKAVEHLALVAGGPHEGASTSAVLQSFFSRLGHIIRTFQEQIVTPPMAVTQFPYSAQVRFHIYLIRNHNEYKPDDPENFDVEDFKRQVLEVAMHRQKFSFTVSQHTLAEDHDLSMAYSRSLRSTVLGSLRLDGTFHSAKRLFLDAAALQEHLRKLHGQFEMASADGDRHIPIFVFSLDFPLPVFIDKYWQAKSMDDMIIAVQSDDTHFVTHLACNGKPIVHNLRNPTRSLLVATLQHLSGVVPSHLFYNHAHQRTSQNWMWSVGCSPEAITATSPGNFSQITLDAAQRNMVISAMSTSLFVANSAVEILSHAQTGKGSDRVFGVIPNDRIVQLHIAIKQSWRKVAAHVKALDFNGAIPIVHTARRNAEKLRSLAEDTATFLNVDSCLRPDSVSAQTTSGTGFDWSLWLSIALAMASMGAYLTYTPARSKPKLI